MGRLVSALAVLCRVAAAHDVSPLAVLGRDQRRPVARARVALYAALRDERFTWRQIGALVDRGPQSCRDALRYWLNEERRAQDRARSRAASGRLVVALREARARVLEPRAA